MLIPQCSRMTSTPSYKFKLLLVKIALREDVSIDDAKLVGENKV